jgi:hypothetical protein
VRGAAAAAPGALAAAAAAAPAASAPSESTTPSTTAAPRFASSDARRPLPRAVARVVGRAAPGVAACARALSAWQQPPWLPLDASVASDVRIAIGGIIAAALRDLVAKELGYTCSAGVAHCKTLAKLCSGRNKPAAQTLLPAAAVQPLLLRTGLRKIRFLGGKLGAALEAEIRAAGLAGISRGGGNGGGGGGGGGGGAAAASHDDDERSIDDDASSDPESGDRDEDGESEVEESVRKPLGGGAAAAGAHAAAAAAAAAALPAPPDAAPITAGDAQGLPLARLRAVFDDETAAYLFRLVRGIDDAVIEPRLRPKSLQAAKSFAEKSAQTWGGACR